MGPGTLISTLSAAFMDVLCPPLPSNPCARRGIQKLVPGGTLSHTRARRHGVTSPMRRSPVPRHVIKADKPIRPNTLYRLFTVFLFVKSLRVGKRCRSPSYPHLFYQIQHLQNPAQTHQLSHPRFPPAPTITAQTPERRRELSSWDSKSRLVCCCSLTFSFFSALCSDQRRGSGIDIRAWG